MGRRASSSLNTTAIIGIVVVVAILIAAGALLLRSKGKATFAGSPLPIDEVFSNANALKGNEYTVEGKVAERHPRDSGLGISLLVESEGEEKPIFIIVPDDVSEINIDRDVSYVFKVRIGKGGVPIATGVKGL